MNVTSVLPNSGPIAGGTQVEINGSGLAGNITVRFGGRDATNVEVLNSTKIRCRTPQSFVTGLAPVSVISSTKGTFDLQDGFNYLGSFGISSVTPNTGRLDGGTSIVIAGTDFLGDISVSIGGQTATVQSVSSDKRQITCLTPPATTPGAKDVVVTSSTEGSTTLSSGFSYLAKPTITSINPPNGPLQGSSLITIVGSDFRGSVTVAIGGQTATIQSISSDKTQITCLTPFNSTPGSKDVVITSYERGTVTRTGGYSYNPQLLVTAVSPTNGPLAGTNPISITCTNLEGTISEVLVGANSVGTFSLSPDRTQVFCNAPPGSSAGPTSVTVTSLSHGTHTLGGAYSYNPAMFITSVSPGNGGQIGGTDLTIIGGNFPATGISVMIGDRPATNIVRLAQDRITCRTPNYDTPSQVDVVVSAATHGMAIKGGAFTFDGPPEITGISPNTGPQGATAAVTISGFGFLGNTINVTVGNQAASGISTSGDGTTINCTFPSSPTPGAKDVTVSSDTRGSVTSTGLFSYFPALDVVSISPTTGSQDGGYFATISGSNFEGAISVSIGGVNIANPLVNGLKTSILITIPSSVSQGARDVVVTSTTHGNDTLGGGFSYTPRPLISDISPNNGPMDATTPITITGQFFAGTMTVTVGGQLCSNISVNGADTAIRCDVPISATGGSKNVIVGSSDNGMTLVSNGFSYNGGPTITKITPPSAPLGATSPITISGTDFNGSVSVSVDGVQATSIQVNGAKDQITCVTPAGSNAGAVDVSVTSSTNGTVLVEDAFVRTDLNFSSPTNFLVGVDPTDVDVADFNRDGFPDLVVSNLGTDNLVVLLGLGDGSFVSAGSFPVGVDPVSVVALERSFDGLVDVVVANRGDDNISILNGTTSGLLGSTTNTSTDADPNFLVASDNLDLSVTGFPQDFVLSNTGSATITVNTSARSPTSAGVPGAIQPLPSRDEVLDDLLVVTSSPPSLTRLKNQGNLAFSFDESFGYPGIPTSIAVGDVTRDGLPDVLVITETIQGLGSAALVIGDSSGDFDTDPPLISIENNPRDCKLIDAEADGDLDAIIANTGSGNITILRNNGIGGLSSGTSIFSAGGTPAALAISDLNLDSLPDIVIAHGGSATTTVGVLLNTSSVPLAGPFSIPNLFPVGSAPNDVIVEDVNRDGHEDLIVVNRDSDSISVLLGYGNGEFAPAIEFAVGDQPVAIAAGDIDRNGTIDLVVSNSGSNTLSVLLGNGTGAFSSGTSVSVASSPRGLLLRQLDLSAGLDIAVSTSSNDAYFYPGDGSGGFGTAVTHSVGAGSRNIAAANLGSFLKLPELIIASNLSNALFVVEDFGIFSGGLTYTRSLSGPQQNLAVGDFDRNGSPDLAITLAGSTVVSIMLSPGSSPTVSEIDLGAGVFGSDALTDIHAVDVNRDGIIDLVVGGGGLIRTLLGVGDGTFSAPSQINAGAGPDAIAVKDINHNGEPDLVFVSTGDPNVRVRLDPF